MTLCYITLGTPLGTSVDGAFPPWKTNVCTLLTSSSPMSSARVLDLRLTSQGCFHLKICLWQLYESLRGRRLLRGFRHSDTDWDRALWSERKCGHITGKKGCVYAVFQCYAELCFYHMISCKSVTAWKPNIRYYPILFQISWAVGIDFRMHHYKGFTRQIFRRDEPFLR